MSQNNQKLDRRDFVLQIMHGTKMRRYTQDTPILPDVWLEYGKYEKKNKRISLLLTPYFGSSPGEVAHLLGNNEPKLRGAKISYNITYTAADFRYDELLQLVIPLTSWWYKHFIQSLLKSLYPDKFEDKEFIKKEVTAKTLFKAVKNNKDDFIEAMKFFEEGNYYICKKTSFSFQILWAIRLIGAIGLLQNDRKKKVNPAEYTPTKLFDKFCELFESIIKATNEYFREDDFQVYNISLNRRADIALNYSTLATKADAARRLFEVDCSNIYWAIIDSGIDASHPAFIIPDATYDDKEDKKRNFSELQYSDSRYEELWMKNTRVKATFDFTRMRGLMDLTIISNHDQWIEDYFGDPKSLKDDLYDILKRNLVWHKERVTRGDRIDWKVLRPLLEIKHDNNYVRRHIPELGHGTHVAGILGSSWRYNKRLNLNGICPDIKLYDFRVIGEDLENNQEFNVLAALQFIHHLNNQKDYYAVHGANLSLAIRHDVSNFACGRTPVCDECDRLVSSGVVVVAAAGNEGYQNYRTTNGFYEGYQTVSISDPGNTDSVITVGSTHKQEPHSYGISYFSSRGPTGDGRSKPDLVAPGEKIKAPVPHAEYRDMDGTSMAAPHVSGAAATLLARHRELIGQPKRIKQILCDSATDLGREKHFQGAGMLDILRAIQSV